MTSEKDILKIKAVLLYLLNKFDKEVDYIKLFKLLYLAQKNHLKLYGIPLIKDDFYTFKAGPAPSITYNICKVANGDLKDKTLKSIANSIQVNEDKIKNIKYVCALEKPELIRLSKSNMNVLDFVYNKYHDHSSNKLSKIAHDSAWKKNWDDSTEKSQRIPIMDVVDAAKVSKGMKSYINETMIMNGMS
ncbi:MAG: SocA family protein [Dysgonamonadaceae bacterium]|jgi:uncharacterized phage-associated protein|nr:SocA family protein [Dysgonamonadaceae bacterium]